MDSQIQPDDVAEATVVPVPFGQMLRRGFTLFGRTVMPGSVLAVVILVPLVFFCGDVVHRFLLAAASYADAHGIRDITPEQFTVLLADHADILLLIYLAMFLLVIAYTYVVTATAIFGWNIVIGESGGFARTFGRPFWMSLIQAILVSVMVSMASFGITLIVSGLPGGLDEMILVLFRVALLYFSAATLFRVHEIVADDRGPWHGLVSSIVLARVDLIRVFLAFLVLILLALLLGAVWFGLASASVFGAAPASILTGGAGLGFAPSARRLATLFEWRSLVAAGLLLALGITLGVNILTSLYTDLRARRGDFSREIDEIEAAA